MAEVKPDNERVPQNEICTRPIKLASKKGTSGLKVKLQGNYFKLTSQTDWCLYQYRVDFIPEETNTFIRKSLLRQHMKVLGFYLCDGTTLYTSNRYKEPFELKTMNDNKKPIVIQLKFVGDLVKGDYQYLQFFNIIVRKCLENLDLQLVGRNYYDPTAKMVIPEYHLELWPGIITSIRQHEREIMMCTEISHKIMRTDNLLSILNKCYTNRRNDYQRDFKNEVIGSVVLTDYNNKTYKIDDVDFTKNPSHTFQLKSGDSISFEKYYSTKYNIKIRDMKQPLLVSLAKARDRRAGASEFLYLVPELCRNTGITDEMKSNFNLMKKLSEKTRIPPNNRIRKLLDFNQKLSNTPQITEDFKRWNFNLDKNLIEVPGRVLPAEDIIFGVDSRNQLVRIKPKNCDWNFEMQDKPAFRAAQLLDWVVLVPSRLKNDALNFLQKMVHTAGAMKFPIPKPSNISEIPNDHAETYIKAIDQVLSRRNPQLILCVVSNNQLLRYASIKKKLCIDRPIPSQVIMGRTLVQKSDSRYRAVGSKVAAQINCKLGGIPWTTDIAKLSPGLMVVGFDVCHIKNGKDYGAMVASLDQNFGRYYSAVSHHEFGTELSNDLSLHLKNALGVFKNDNQGRLPSRIVIYRDGVGEGQTNFVYDYEVKEIKKTLQRIYGHDNYKLGFIIVTKRLNTRIFYDQKNASPGTVVDDVITDPLKYDFFIVSQSVNEGTVSPTAYNVIEDTTGLSPDVIQQMTFKLCHMYFNFTGTVRVPAPCQYAHKLAFFASTALQGPAKPELQKFLYFL